MAFRIISKIFSKPSSWINPVDELPKHSGWYQILAVYEGDYFIQVSFYESSAEKFISSRLNTVRLSSKVEVRCWRECRRSRLLNFKRGFQGGEE